ncbi:hypothetical protein LEP1GSC070_3435 [Leptospira santarosai str. AIM]|nr:hypothetical protein LEP1GSC070_3435 [Leptospira santarosai str. AIM]
MTLEMWELIRRFSAKTCNLRSSHILFLGFETSFLYDKKVRS